MEQRIGRVCHYFSRLGVAAIVLEHGTIRRGDRIHFVGHTTDLEQVVDSMEVDHRQVCEVEVGQQVAIKVDDHVRKNDLVYMPYF